ncbi:MAG: ATP-binding protein, partial [Candidatus Poribacteria bacterium]
MFKLKKSDFGGDIISILTKGMYADPKDALREYIQNGVDAGAKNISIKIRQNSIVIDDDGRGMDHEIMRKAIRLGISNK